MNAAIQMKNVTKRYGDFTLNDVTLTLPSGCIMGLIGENGAGKSTTIKSILGLNKIDGGQISILGQPMSTDAREIKENLGVVLDENCFAENLTGKEIEGIMSNIYSTWESGKFKSLLAKFSLPENKAVKHYSRGMKMKLSIAVALSHDSKLMVLDEATSGLDPMAREELLDVFLEYIQDESRSILISSHILSDLEKICDYIAFIHHGKVLLAEPKDEMMERHGILKCDEGLLAQLDPAAIRGIRQNKFGVEALVVRDLVPADWALDSASLEDIMLYYAKENR